MRTTTDCQLGFVVVPLARRNGLDIPRGGLLDRVV